MQNKQTAIARILLALVFLGLVLLKIKAITSTPDGYLQYQMTLGQFGLPALFAPLLILIQLVGGFALLVGFKTKFFARLMAFLAVFFAAVLSQVSLDLLFLYLGIAGGLWLLSIYPDTALSIDKPQ